MALANDGKFCGLLDHKEKTGYCAALQRRSPFQDPQGAFRTNPVHEKHFGRYVFPLHVVTLKKLLKLEFISNVDRFNKSTTSTVSAPFEPHS